MVKLSKATSLFFLKKKIVPFHIFHKKLNSYLNPQELQNMIYLNELYAYHRVSHNEHPWQPNSAVIN